MTTKDDGGPAPDLFLTITEVGMLDDGEPGVVLRGSLAAIREAAKLFGDEVVLIAFRGGRDE
jgi:hypothetical protein